MMFPATPKEIANRIQAIDPAQYASTRNYGKGAVTYLSPYISRGVISTRQVLENLLERDMPWHFIEKLVQELAWRDYWQHVWKAKGDAIFSDLKHPQTPVSGQGIPTAILQANTGIEAVDKALQELFETGYMHNHMRMYVASLCCNIAQSHWLIPAQWLYSQLLDGDIASNHLSWQWVAGSNANKKYYANQENINRYFNSQQRNTYLDTSYEALTELQVPPVLNEKRELEVSYTLPKGTHHSELKPVDTLIYDYYNLDPEWHVNEDYQRILLLEPSFFDRYPVSQKCIQFVMELKDNIDGIKVVVMEFDELTTHLKGATTIYKEHPTHQHYSGRKENRDWMSSVEGYFPSFFGFWKKCKKELLLHVR